jgi:hypothetical protein
MAAAARCAWMRTASIVLLVLVLGAGVAAAAPPCRADGRWEIAWRARGRASPVRSVRPVPLTLAVARGGDGVEGAFDEMTPARTDAVVRVDRVRCTATITLRAAIDFADDVGNQDEWLQVTADLRGDGGALSGRLRVDEDGRRGPHWRARVVGHARRLVAE